MVSLGDYAGREQSYVKHVFLERYLEALIFKTAMRANGRCRVFAFPWRTQPYVAFFIRRQDHRHGLRVDRLDGGCGGQETSATKWLRLYELPRTCEQSMQTA